MVFVLILSNPVHSMGQDNSLNPQFPSAPADSNYIEDYTEKITGRLYLLFQNATFVLNPDQGAKIVYKPNVNIRMGIAGFWKWFGLGLSIENPFVKWSTDKYGRTSFVDLRINAFGRALAAEIFLQNFKGFYIFNAIKKDGTRYLLPEMSSFSLGVSTYWIYNARRFSIRAAFIQNERQIKSAGSIIIRPSILFSRILSPSGIIPQEIVDEANIPVTDRVVNADMYSFGLSPGYSYTFVFLKNLYLTINLFAGVFWQYYSYNTKTNDFIADEFSFQLNGLFAFGYNSDKWFVGCSVQGSPTDFPDNPSNTFFNYDVAQYRIWGGTRFNWFRKKKK